MRKPLLFLLVVLCVCRWFASDAMAVGMLASQVAQAPVQTMAAHCHEQMQATAASPAQTDTPAQASGEACQSACLDCCMIAVAMAFGSPVSHQAQHILQATTLFSALSIAPQRLIKPPIL